MARHKKPRNERRPTILDGVLQFLCGLCVMGLAATAMFFGWMYYGTGMDTGTITRQLERSTPVKIETVSEDRVATLRTDNIPPEREPNYGELFAYIRVPSLGKDWKRPIQQGVDDAILASMGAGHYPKTALPGQQGNSAYAGHDTPTDFGAFYDLPSGTEVILESAANWYVYRLNRHLLTTVSDVSVLEPDAADAERGITLTTCWPRFAARDTGQRFVWHGSFVGWAPKSDGVPQALATRKVTVSERLNRHLDTVSEQVGMPVTGVLAIGSLAMWVICNCICWLCNYRRAAERWLRSSWNPVVWIWRLQGGMTGNRYVSAVIRSLTLALFVAACTFAMWRGVCPWMVDTFAFLPDVPRPAI